MAGEREALQKFVLLEARADRDESVGIRIEFHIHTTAAGLQ